MYLVRRGFLSVPRYCILSVRLKHLSAIGTYITIIATPDCIKAVKRSKILEKQMSLPGYIRLCYDLRILGTYKAVYRRGGYKIIYNVS